MQELADKFEDKLHQASTDLNNRTDRLERTTDNKTKYYHR